MIKYISLSLFASVLLISCETKEENPQLVYNVKDFNEKVASAVPGDTIRLANGVWENAELLFEGQGSEENPIVLSVEEKGKVTLEGNSNLRIAGEHLVVEGLVFKNGYTPTNEVISFKKDKENLANNCRLTEVVIDRYNNPERHETETWVAIYGKHNRVDHNHLAGKNTKGVTLIVRLNSEESEENENQIDHNYFGHRPNLGSNGGETLRIGTSHYSMVNSKTQVVSNYFDRCNGEHEIISNKSNQNVYKYNTFFECTGTLTMRHGNETMVDGNVFIGNNKPSTGGIRVINGQQTVVNNYGVGLTGYRFRGAFVIMNGVPNSPLNRYFQVEDATVKNNTFINCDHVQLCAGSDAERSATPINSVVANNIFYNENKDDVFTVYDDISGITFENNLLSPNIEPVADGFTKRTLELKRDENGFLLPADESIAVGAEISDEIATKENTGVSWYSKADWMVSLSSGKTINVEPGLNNLVNAAQESEAGDILVLSAGNYNNTKAISVSHPLTIKASGDSKPVLLFEKKSLFDIENGGALRLEGLKFDGENAPDDNGNTVISTSKYSMNQNYKLFVENCDFVNLDVNHSFDAVKVYKNTFADTVSIKNSRFENLTGNVMAFDKETDDIGIYNVEYVILKNNVFKDIGGAALRLYRGGTDESTFGPFLEIEHSVFDNVGHDKRNKYDAAVSLYGVQEIDIKNNIFKDSKAINMHLVVGEPIVKVANNALSNSENLKVTGDQKYTVENQWQLAPEFVNTDTYELKTSSPLKGKATDGSDLGLKF